MCKLNIDNIRKQFYTLVMKDILRSLRIENNYSQSAVASYLEISRQMYNKYEMGNAEPSLKIIKKLCELYKVSADVFLNSDKLSKNENNSYEQYNYNYSDMYVSSPKAIYGTSFADKNNNDNLLAELINLLPLLQLNEQILLMSRLASIIENETFTQNKPSLKTKKIKKIPDAEYNRYLISEETQKRRSSSLASIREMLKNDEW